LERLHRDKALAHVTNDEGEKLNNIDTCPFTQRSVSS